MNVAERHFKKEIRLATFSYLSEMKFKRNEKQKKTIVYSKCTDFSFFTWRPIWQDRVLNWLLYVFHKHENECFCKLAQAHATQELSLTRGDW